MAIPYKNKKIFELAVTFLTLLIIIFLISKAGPTNTLFWKLFIGFWISILILCLKDIYIFYIIIVSLPIPLYFKGFSIGTSLIIAFL